MQNENESSSSPALHGSAGGGKKKLSQFFPNNRKENRIVKQTLKLSHFCRLLSAALVLLLLLTGCNSGNTPEETTAPSTGQETEKTIPSDETDDPVVGPPKIDITFQTFEELRNFYSEFSRKNTFLLITLEPSAINCREWKGHFHALHHASGKYFSCAYAVSFQMDIPEKSEEVEVWLICEDQLKTANDFPTDFLSHLEIKPIETSKGSYSFDYEDVPVLFCTLNDDLEEDIQWQLLNTIKEALMLLN